MHELRDRLARAVQRRPSDAALQISLVSFGYKHGVPLDVDLVFDCRFLPNPHWVDELRPLPGTDAPVRDYVLGQPDTQAFLEELRRLFQLLLPGVRRARASRTSRSRSAAPAAGTAASSIAAELARCWPGSATRHRCTTGTSTVC